MRVVALDHRVVDGRRRRHVGRVRAALGLPLGAAAVEQAHVVVAEQAEHPEGVGRPPVVLVAVDDDRRVAGDALRAEQLREARAIQVVAGHRVVEVGVPVDLDRALDVAGLVEQHVLVGLDHDQAGLPQGARRATRVLTRRSGWAKAVKAGDGSVSMDICFS